MKYIRDLDFDGVNMLDDRLLNAELKKVTVVKDAKEMRIYLLSDNIIQNGDLEKLKDAIGKRFSKFNFLDFQLEYSKTFSELFADYKSVILDVIRSEVPSSLGWIQDLSIEHSDKSVTLNLSNEVGKISLKSKGLDRCIENKIECEFKEKIRVSINHLECESESDHESCKEQEERQLAEKLRRGSLEIGAIPKKESRREGKDTPSRENAPQDSKWKNSRASRSIVKVISGEKTPIDDVNINSGTVIVEGEIFDLEKKEIKGNKKIYTFHLTDLKNSVTVKVFVSEKEEESVSEVISDGNYVRLSGDAIYDTFSRQLCIMLKGIEKLSKEKKLDRSDEKRVELHCHTKMSSMDGISGAKELVKRASEWGHKAIAITDHGVVQGFPEAMYASESTGIKIIYGLEGYLVDDESDIVENAEARVLDCEYTVFDLETTGFSARNDMIIEIGAVKLKDNKIVDRFSELINPGVSIPPHITELTGITDQMVKDCETIDSVLPRFIEFAGDTVLVAHNADFDMSFIRTKLDELSGGKIENPVLDTLTLGRIMYPKLRNHKLKTLAKHLDVSLENHHRAVDDSRATADILTKSIEKLKAEEIETLAGLNEYARKHRNINQARPYHIIILAKDYTGLKNLYKLVSLSHLNHFYKKPRIPKTLLNEHREGLILGTACEAGELYGAMLKNEDEMRIEKIASYYDYLEIQPVGNNGFLVQNQSVGGVEELRNINKRIVELGDRLGKRVVATGDVHFLDAEDEVYRRILMAGQGYSDAEDQAPLYLKTTDEMLEEFSYLGEETARRVVIDNTNAIAEEIEEMKPIPDGTFPPVIEGADEELREMNYKRAVEIYGEELPEIVKSRLDRELNSIISNGYAVMYIIAQKLVKKSNEDGYLVGSRGSVGSSFVATMSGITEVNPLAPHYICHSCKYSEFILDESVGSGVDLPDAKCPQCGGDLTKDGHNIPFEVFLGFEGDKEPDIDLNFAGEYQPNAHKYTEELFGTGYVFRAGTIGTVAEKTAYGFVKKYFESKDKTVSPAEINRLVKGCTGIKRTSGQHPGGVMVVPAYKEIYDFSPIQYPADDSGSGVITTHFDYNSISGRILKLDILGHDVPSIIRMLEDLTGVKPEDIRLDDEDTRNLFLGTEVLGVKPEDINSETGTLGIPEFGTKFVRQMLEDTRPTTFSELVRISGLSHGTDVWVNNAQDLVREGTASLSEVICTRDDIMNYLIHCKMDKKLSFKIMEKVRKGKGITEEEESIMRENHVPEWYIESCKRIKYMFPKAHAVAYVMMSFRIAYFKVHYPEAFYATYFTTKAADFDAELVLKGREFVKNKIKELEDMGNMKTAKEKNLLTVLEVCLEMYSRGFKFERVDLYRSGSDKFQLGENGIVPPLKSLEGVGENAARNIVAEREKGRFISIEDLTKRAKCSKTVIEALRLHGCLDGMQETNQLNLFNF